jgi:hypothetical protein
MNKIWFALLGAALSIPAAGTTQPAPTAAKSVQLSKVILDTDGPEIKGRLKVGTICLFSGGKFNFTKEKRTANYERYDNLFTAALKEHGFNVVTTTDDLFAGEGNSPKGDLLIGATVRPDVINMCSSVNGEKGDVTLIVEWKIFDRNTQKIVETVTTTGHGEQPNFSHTGLTNMWNQAFVSSLNALVAQGLIQKYVGKAGS